MLGSSNPLNDREQRAAFYAALNSDKFRVNNLGSLLEIIRRELFGEGVRDQATLQRKTEALEFIKKIPFFSGQQDIDLLRFSKYIKAMASEIYPNPELLFAFSILTRSQLKLALSENEQLSRSKAYKPPFIKGSSNKKIILAAVKRGGKVVGFKALTLSEDEFDELPMEVEAPPIEQAEMQGSLKGKPVESSSPVNLTTITNLSGNSGAFKDRVMTGRRATVASAKTIASLPQQPIQITEEERNASIPFYAEIGPRNFNELLQELLELIEQSNYSVVACSARDQKREKKGTIYVFSAKPGQLLFAVKDQPSFSLSLGTDATRNLMQCVASGGSVPIDPRTKNEIVGEATKIGRLQGDKRLNLILSSIGKVTFEGVPLNANNFAQYVNFCSTQQRLYPEPGILYAYGALKDIQFSFLEMNQQGQYQPAKSERYRPAYVLGLDKALSGAIQQAKKAVEGELGKIKNIALLVGDNRGLPVFQVLKSPDGNAPTRQEMRELQQPQRQKKQVSFDVQTVSHVPVEIIESKKRNFKDELVHFIEENDPSINNPVFIKFLKAMMQENLLSTEIFACVSEYLTDSDNINSQSLLREWKVEQLSGHFELLTLELHAWMLGDQRFQPILGQLSALEKSQTLGQSKTFSRLRIPDVTGTVVGDVSTIQSGLSGKIHGDEIPSLVNQSLNQNIQRRPSFIPPPPPRKTFEEPIVEEREESVAIIPRTKQAEKASKAGQAKDAQLLRVAQVPAVASKLIRFVENTRSHNAEYFKQFLALASNFISPESKATTKAENIRFYEQILAYLKKMEQVENGSLKDSARQILADIAGLKHATSNDIHAQFAIRVLTLAADVFKDDIASRTTWTQKSFSPDSSMNPDNMSRPDLSLSGASFSQLLRRPVPTASQVLRNKPLTSKEREAQERENLASLMSQSGARAREQYKTLRMAGGATGEKPSWNNTTKGTHLREDRGVDAEASDSLALSGKASRKAPLDMGKSANVSRTLLKKQDKKDESKIEPLEELTRRINAAFDRLLKAHDQLPIVDDMTIEAGQVYQLSKVISDLFNEVSAERAIFEKRYEDFFSNIEGQFKKQIEEIDRDKAGQLKLFLRQREAEVSELESNIHQEIAKYDSWMIKKRVLDQELQWANYFGDCFEQLAHFRTETKKMLPQLRDFSQSIRAKEKKITKEDSPEILEKLMSLYDRLNEVLFQKVNAAPRKIEEQIIRLKEIFQDNTEERMSEEDARDIVQEVVGEAGRNLTQLREEMAAFAREIEETFREIDQLMVTQRTTLAEPSVPSVFKPEDSDEEDLEEKLEEESEEEFDDEDSLEEEHVRDATIVPAVVVNVPQQTTKPVIQEVEVVEEEFEEPEDESIMGLNRTGSLDVGRKPAQVSIDLQKPTGLSQITAQVASFSGDVRRHIPWDRESLEEEKEDDDLIPWSTSGISAAAAAAASSLPANQRRIQENQDNSVNAACCLSITCGMGLPFSGTSLAIPASIAGLSFLASAVGGRQKKSDQQLDSSDFPIDGIHEVEEDKEERLLGGRVAQHIENPIWRSKQKLLRSVIPVVEEEDSVSEQEDYPFDVDLGSTYHSEKGEATKTYFDNPIRKLSRVDGDLPSYEKMYRSTEEDEESLYDDEDNPMRMDKRSFQAEKGSEVVSANSCLNMTCNFSVAMLSRPVICVGMAGHSFLSWATRSRSPSPSLGKSSENEEVRQLREQVRSLESQLHSVQRQLAQNSSTSTRRRTLSFNDIDVPFSPMRREVPMRSLSMDTGLGNRELFNIDMDKLEQLTLSGKALDGNFISIKRSLQHLMKDSGFVLAMKDFSRKYGFSKGENTKDIIAMMREVSDLMHKECTRDTVKLAEALEGSVATLFACIKNKEDELLEAKRVLDESKLMIDVDPELQDSHGAMWKEKYYQYQKLIAFWEREYGFINRDISLEHDNEESLKRHYFEMASIEGGNSQKISGFVLKLLFELRLAAHYGVTLNTSEKPPEFYSKDIDLDQWSDVVSVNSEDTVVPAWVAPEREGEFQIRDKRGIESRITASDKVKVYYDVARDGGQAVLKSAFAEMNGVRVEGVLKGNENNPVDRQRHAAMVLESAIHQLSLFISNNGYQWPSTKKKIRIENVDDVTCVYVVGALSALGVDFNSIEIDKRKLELYRVQRIPKPEYVQEVYSKSSFPYPIAEVNLQKASSTMVKQFLDNFLGAEGATDKIKTPKKIPKIVEAREEIKKRVEAIKATREAMSQHQSEVMGHRQKKVEKYVKVKGLDPLDMMPSPVPRRIIR